MGTGRDEVYKLAVKYPRRKWLCQSWKWLPQGGNRVLGALAMRVRVRSGTQRGVEGDMPAGQ